MRRSLALVLAVLMFSGAWVAAPGLSTQAAAASGDLTVTIASPAHNAVLASPLVPVTWTSSVPDGDVWFCEVQLDQNPILVAQTTEGHLFQGVPEGYHTVKVWIYNQTGERAFDSVNFIVDTSDPSLSITSPANGAWLSSSTTNVTWSATDPSLIAFFNVSLDGGDGQLLPPSKTYMAIDLEDGPHTFVIEAHDRIGNTAVRTVSFTVDTIAPAVEITSPDNGTGFNHDDVTVSWSGSSTDTTLVGYQIWVDGVKNIDAATTARQFTHGYSDGHHTVTIVAVDKAGNTVSDSVTFFVDTTELSLMAHTPTGGSEAIDVLIAVQFSKEMDHSATAITVSGVAGTMQWDGLIATFVPSSALSYGTGYTATVTGEDLVGNPITFSWSFTTTDLGTITGIVRNSNGNPLEGATVTLDDGQSFVTNATGRYYFQASAGTHELTIAKSGWASQTLQVDLAAGQFCEMGDLTMAPNDILTMLGIVAAVIAVVIVGIMVYLGRHRKGGRRRPPARAPVRSRRGMSDLQRRAMQNSRRIDDDDDGLDGLDRL